jgi:ParB family chromosome partitioning protein
MKTTAQLREIPIEQLVPGRFQPRVHFDEEKLQELAEAIKTTKGLLQPIVVRMVNPEKFEIIAGERRWRAAMLAQFDTVSCLLRETTDLEALEAAIIENVCRTDLNPIEEAQAYQRLINDFGYIHEEIAAAVGKSRVTITNSLRMLKLDPRVQNLLMEGILSGGHGKILAGMNAALQYEVATKSVKNSWSVRKLEQEARKLLAPKENKELKDVNIQALERALADHIGCQVNIDWENSKGKLEIDFHNLDILEGVFKKLGFSW